MRLLVVVATLAVFCSLASGSAPADTDIEGLINQLPATSEMGYGYSDLFSGEEFLPYPNSAKVDTLVLNAPGPKKSAALDSIVKAGPRAVPFLLKHLDDKRPTKIPAITGMMWTDSPDEYDFNSFTRADKPKGVNREEGLAQQGEQDHQITVGDLCFVALGQIVNRHFNATRYQPSGGLIVNSPTSSPRLCAVVRSDFQALTPERHLQLLLEDFAKPDSEGRRIGAYLRLSFYYPNEVEARVLDQLQEPGYDVFKTEKFVRDTLYSEKLPERRKELLEEFERASGPASKDGLLVQLFNDLDLQEADEQHRLTPPLAQKLDARSVLVQRFGFKPDVTSRDAPQISTWSLTEKARFIEALVHSKSERTDEAVYRIFVNSPEDEDLALACIRHLAGRSYERELREYCLQQITKGGPSSETFRKALDAFAAGPTSKPSEDR